MFSSRERATVLAALQYWRQEMCPHGHTVMLPYFADFGLDQVKPLNVKEIGRLMDRLRP